MKTGTVETKDNIMTTLFVLLPAVILSCCMSPATAMPTSVNIRSSPSHNGQATSVHGNRQMHLADGILCDMMMQRADSNSDGMLSGREIAWFYQHVAFYTPYVASMYGGQFIQIADANGDHMLDRTELLRMLVEMNASDWTRR